MCSCTRVIVIDSVMNHSGRQTLRADYVTTGSSNKQRISFKNSSVTSVFPLRPKITPAVPAGTWRLQLTSSGQPGSALRGPRETLVEMDECSLPQASGEGVGLNDTSMSSPIGLNKTADEGSRSGVQTPFVPLVNLQDIQWGNAAVPRPSFHEQLKRSISDIVERNGSGSCDIFQASRYGEVDTVQELLNGGWLEMNELDDSGLSPIHLAARYDQVEVLQTLLNHGADPDLESSMIGKLHTPLHLASWFNSVGAARLLISSGAGVAKQAAFGQQPLHYAASRGSKELIKILIETGGADPNGKDHEQCTPLHMAAQRGRLDIAKILLSYGAKINCRDNELSTPLHLAAKEGHSDVMALLLKRGAFPDPFSKDILNSENIDGKSCLHLAVENGHLKAAKLCVDCGASIIFTNGHTTALHLACTRGHLDMVKLFILAGCPLNKEDHEGMTPILRASLSGHVRVIQHLLNEGAEVAPPFGSNALSPLVCAVKRGNKEAVRLLIQRGSPIHLRDSHLRTCLHVAVYSADQDTLGIILENGGFALINSRDKSGKTPLHYAAAKGDPQIMQILLTCGASVDVKDEEERLPLHLAAEGGNLLCVKVLLEKQPDSINSTDYRLRVPLHYAALEGYEEVVKYLLNQGANVDYRDDDRLTPLLLVSRRGNADVITLLLDRGAKIDALSKNRSSPLDVASFFGATELVQLFLDRGSRLDNNSVFGHGCLDAAASSGQIEVCMLIVRHPRWKEALKAQNENGFQVMEKLIAKVPMAAKVVMDRCIESSNHPSTDFSYSVTYNFEFICPHPDFAKNAEGRRYFGPKTMMDHGRKQLLTHPLTEKLMKYKWKGMKMHFFYFSLLLYLVFLSVITLMFLCFTKKDLHPYDPSEIELKEFQCSDFALNSASILTSCISILFLMGHLYRMIVERQAYFHTANFLELSTFVLSLYTAVVMYQNTDLETLISLAVVSVLLAYFTLLSYLPSLMKSGIYVTMLFEVLRTLIKVMLVFALMLFAFALVFQALLSRRANALKLGKTYNVTTYSKADPFGTLDLSLLKVVDMMVGEMEYTRFFVEQDLYVPDITRAIFVMFCVVIPIVLMNLLIGLAVGDIESIQKNAELKLLALEIEDTYATEGRVPLYFLRRMYKSSVVEFPNKLHTTFCNKLRGIGSKLLATINEKSPLQTEDDIPEQVNALLTRRLFSMEQRLNKFNSVIEYQTETLEKIIKILQDKEDDSNGTSISLAAD